MSSSSSSLSETPGSLSEWSAGDAAPEPREPAPDPPPLTPPPFDRFRTGLWPLGEPVETRNQTYLVVDDKHPRGIYLLLSSCLPLCDVRSRGLFSSASTSPLSCCILQRPQHYSIKQ